MSPSVDVARPGSSVPVASGAPRWRWLLLIPMIAGLLGMHVLTGGDALGGHGPLPTAAHEMPADHAVEVVPGADPHAAAVRTTAIQTVAVHTAATDTAAELTAAPSGGMEHGGMAACILFLVVGGAVALVALLKLRRRERRIGVTVAGAPPANDILRRGPPGPVRPRLALCVDRN